MTDTCGVEIIHGGQPFRCGLEPGHDGVHIAEEDTLCWTAA